MGWSQEIWMESTWQACRQFAEVVPTSKTWPKLPSPMIRLTRSCLGGSDFATIWSRETRWCVGR